MAPNCATFGNAQRTIAIVACQTSKTRMCARLKIWIGLELGRLAHTVASRRARAVRAKTVFIVGLQPTVIVRARRTCSSSKASKFQRIVDVHRPSTVFSFELA